METLPRATGGSGRETEPALGSLGWLFCCEVFAGFTLEDKAAACTRFGSGDVGPGTQEWDRLDQGLAQPLAMECAGFSFRSRLSRGVWGLELEPRRCPRSVGCRRWGLGRTGVAKWGNGPWWGQSRALPRPRQGLPFPLFHVRWTSEESTKPTPEQPNRREPDGESEQTQTALPGMS